MRSKAVVALVAAAALGSLSGPAAVAGEPPNVVHAEVPVTAVDLQAGFAHNSPVLAVDPTDARTVVAATRLDGPDFGCALHVSGDAGRTWLPSPVPDLPPGAEKCYAPEIAFGPDGTFHFLFVGLAGKGNSPMGAFLATRSGGSLSTPRQVLGPERYMVRMAVDQRSGRIHVVWLEARSDPPLGGLPVPPNPIMAAHSDDGGRTFTAPVQVNDPSRQRVVAPALAVGNDGAVHVAYYDLMDDARDYQGLEGPRWEGTWSLVVSSSADGGATFARHRLVDDALAPPERVMLIFTMPPPALAVGTGARVYVAWHDARRGDWDVFLSASGDDGRNWSEPRRLNDDPVGNGLHQHLPRLAVAPDGRLDAVFYDRRADPANRHNDVWFTTSADAGRTFSPNLRLTTEASDAHIGPRYAVPSARGLVELGSRLGLVALPAAAMAAWADTRNSPTDSRQQDVFSTTVDLGSGDPARPGRGTSVRWWMSAGAILLAAFVIAVALRRGRTSRRPTPESGAGAT